MKDLETLNFIERAEQANERFNRMDLQQFIEVWNDSACDHYCRFFEVHEINDLDWFDQLNDHYGTSAVRYAIEMGIEDGIFRPSDRYYFYDEDNDRCLSFSDRQGFIAHTGDDFFLDALMNE